MKAVRVGNPTTETGKGSFCLWDVVLWHKLLTMNTEEMNKFNS